MDYTDFMKGHIARELANYIQKIQTLVNNNDKFYACLPTVIIEFGYSTNAESLAQQIIDNG